MVVLLLCLSFLLLVAFLVACFLIRWVICFQIILICLFWHWLLLLLFLFLHTLLLALFLPLWLCCYKILIVWHWHVFMLVLATLSYNILLHALLLGCSFFLWWNIRSLLCFYLKLLCSYFRFDYCLFFGFSNSCCFCFEVGLDGFFWFGLWLTFVLFFLTLLGQRLYFGIICFGWFSNW